MTEKLTKGTSKYTEVWKQLEADDTEICRHYGVCPTNPKSTEKRDNEFCFVRFQNGPIKENGVNGCYQEDLLHIVLDRLNNFQKGDFRCRENSLAITKIEEALHWLRHRTQDREDRRVEGTSKV